MKTTKTNKNNEIQIGDKVKFVVGTSLLTGVITKFYKNSYGDEECSVKTELNTSSGKINQKIFPHILLHRVSKIEGKDEVEVVREMRQQIVDLEQENKQLKEQLEELIKQGATIYSISKETFIAGVSDLLKIKPLKLDSKVYGISVDKYNEINNCKPHLYIGNDYTPFEKVAELENLFETEEDARWELEMTATRTETLKLPNWNELNLNYSHCKEFYKSFYNKDSKYTLEINIPDTIALFYYGNNDGEVECGYIFDRDFTKENYIEACKLCLRLFKGEEV